MIMLNKNIFIVIVIVIVIVRNPAKNLRFTELRHIDIIYVAVAQFVMKQFKIEVVSSL